MTINPRTLIALEFQISSFVQSFERHFSIIDGIDIVNCNSETARNFFSSWHGQIAKEKEQLSAIQELWPDGFLFTNKFGEFITTQVEFVENLARMRDFVKTRLDTSNSKSMEESRELILKERKLRPLMENLFNAANEILKDATGLDINNYFQNSQDFNKLDTTPEGIERLKRYMGKVTEILIEYKRVLLICLDHHNQLTISPKLIRNKEWVSTARLLMVQLLGISNGIVPGKVTPTDIDTEPGCQDIYLKIRNLKDLSQQIYSDYCNFYDKKDSRGLVKASETLVEEIIKEWKGLYSEIEKVNSQLIPSE